MPRVGTLARGSGVDRAFGAGEGSRKAGRIGGRFGGEVRGIYGREVVVIGSGVRR